MIKRYQSFEIANIWSFENQVNYWVTLEILIAKFWWKEGQISQVNYQDIAKCKTDLKRLQILESQTHHQLASVVQMMEEQAGASGKWIHYGLTSNDVLDTIQNKLIDQSLIVVETYGKKLYDVLWKLALKHKDLLCLGRTHGQGAEPITYGYKFAFWSDEIKQHLIDLINVKSTINCVKISGPTGMYSHVPLALAQFVAQEWKMKVSLLNNQLMNRNKLLRVVHVINRLSVSLEKFAIEFRNLSRLEINEIQEGFSSKQKGSSAMPHKKNPLTCENITGLMRLLRSLTHTFEATNLLWHERDLSNSAIERVGLPDLFHLITTGLQRTINVMENLVINQKQIVKNLHDHEVAVFSHSVLLMLLKKSQLSRNDAYQLVQTAAKLTQTTEIDFQTALKKTAILKHLTSKDLIVLFDFKQFLQPLQNNWNIIMSHHYVK